MATAGAVVRGGTPNQGDRQFSRQDRTANIAASSSGNNTIVAAVPNRRIRVTGMRLMSNGTVNLKWRSGTTDISGLSYHVVNGGEVLGYNPRGWFTTAVGEALVLNLSAAIAVGGHITYEEV